MRKIRALDARFNVVGQRSAHVASGHEVSIPVRQDQGSILEVPRWHYRGSWVSVNAHCGWNADLYARIMLGDRSRLDGERIHP
jgi:hypothetical protein